MTTRVTAPTAPPSAAKAHVSPPAISGKGFGHTLAKARTAKPVDKGGRAKQPVAGKTAAKAGGTQGAASRRSRSQKDDEGGQTSRRGGDVPKKGTSAPGKQEDQSTKPQPELAAKADLKPNDQPVMVKGKDQNPGQNKDTRKDPPPQQKPTPDPKSPAAPVKQPAATVHQQAPVIVAAPQMQTTGLSTVAGAAAVSTVTSAPLLNSAIPARSGGAGIQTVTSAASGNDGPPSVGPSNQSDGTDAGASASDNSLPAASGIEVPAASTLNAASPIEIQHAQTSTPASINVSAAGITSGLSPAIPLKAEGVQIAAAAGPSLAPEAQFGQTNHANIVSAIRGQLLPGGGTMHIRLDPPELGPLQVSVKVENGVISASFHTSSDQATKLLSHSLGDLKQTLESQGLTVSRLHVEQSPKGQSAAGKQGDDAGGRQGEGQAQAQGHEMHQQQRREMLQRMWRRVAGGGDPLDLVA